MYTNVKLAAPIGVLLFLGTALLIFCLVLVVIFPLITKETWLPPLRPGESYQTRVVFDLPADIQSPTLLIHEGGPETHFVIGHENSLLHRKTKFQI